MTINPFATAEKQTYTYPAPFEKDDELVNQKILSAIDAGEEAPFVTLRIPHSAEDVDAIADYAQTVVAAGDNGDGGVFQARIGRANRGVFELLVEGWSFTDRQPTGADYARLGTWAANWVRACLRDAREKGEQADAKKEKPSNGSPKTSPTSSEAEAAIASP